MGGGGGQDSLTPPLDTPMDVEPILSDKYNVLYLCQINTPFRFIVFADFKGRHW